MRTKAYEGLKIERRGNGRWHIRNLYAEDLGFRTLADVRWFIDALRAGKPRKAKEQRAWIRAMRERAVKERRCAAADSP